MTTKTITSTRSRICCFLFVVLVFLPVFINCVKYSSKYNDKILTQRIDGINRKYNNFTPKLNSNMKYSTKIINTNVDNNNSYNNNTKNIGKYISSIFSYIKDDHSFVETRKDVIPFYQNKSQIIQNKIEHPKDKAWTKKVVECVSTKGLIDCMKIFLLRRVDRVNEMMDESKSDDNVSIAFDDLIDEIRKDFKWEEYKSLNEEDIDKLMMKKIQDLVEKKGLSLIFRSGIVVDIAPHNNGSVRLDIRTDPDVQLPRGMKWKKYAYRIVPMMLMPSLFITAILPFMLPALKLMVLGAGLLNQMALTGSIFSLIRNNIFNDEYETKVVYLNQGYKNEYHSSKKHYPPVYQGHKTITSKLRYPAFTTEKYENFYEDTHPYSHFNEEFSRPVIEPVEPLEPLNEHFYNQDFKEHYFDRTDLGGYNDRNKNLQVDDGEYADDFESTKTAPNRRKNNYMFPQLRQPIRG